MASMQSIVPQPLRMENLMMTFDANDLSPYVDPEHPDIIAIGETTDAIAARDEAANQ
jgi:hypothetical protein